MPFPNLDSGDLGTRRWLPRRLSVGTSSTQLTDELVPIGFDTLRIFLLGLVIVTLSDFCPAGIICAGRLPPVPQPISNNAVTSVDNGDGTWSVYSFMGIQGPGFRDITGQFLSIGFAGWSVDSNCRRAAIKQPSQNRRECHNGSGTSLFDRRLHSAEYHRDHKSDCSATIRSTMTTWNWPQCRQVDDTVAAVYQDRYIYLVSGWHGPVNNNVLDVRGLRYANRSVAGGDADSGARSGPVWARGTIIDGKIVVFDGTQTSGGFTISDQVLVGQIDPDQTGDLSNISWQVETPHPGSPTYRARCRKAPLLVMRCCWWAVLTIPTTTMAAATTGSRPCHWTR